VTLTFSGIATLLMLAFYNPGLAATAIALVAVVAAASVVLALREMRAVRDLLGASSQSHELLHVLISAVPTLRATGATERLVERWAGLVRGQTLHGIRRDNLRLSRVVVAQAGRHAATWIATAWLIQHALAGAMTLGMLMAATLLVGNWVRIGTGLTGTVLGLVSLRPHWERVNALLANAAAPLREPLTARDVRQSAHQGLRLSGVSFRYEAHGRFILDGYSTYFPAGKHTILQAASGSGKSTILRLLAGLVTPEAGQVSVFGRDPRLCTGLVAYLPQQSSLLEASIGTNLTALSGAPLEHTLRVAQWTGLAEMLATLPMGHETLVAAGGSNLSAGQRQLVLLTAVFSGAQPVVLLDEATSQLDAAALARIQWTALCQGRTVVSVTHAT
jgi:ABC-type bacteriocin/lantibiotic exporter with double-glycine peptidase domain